jgi:SAM-dependent methyltransferase
MSANPANTNSTADEQAILWNGVAGRSWLALQDLLDDLFAELTKSLVDGIAGRTLDILDVGCGPGTTTIAAAQALQSKGKCVGIDISQPLIDAARARQSPASVSFICADASEYAFTPNVFDLLISRFGVMFFNDPVRAFANLRFAVKHGGELRCLSWRSIAENPFMTTAENAARPFLPSLPVRGPNVPGQFGLADETYVISVLSQAGWQSVELQPFDVECVFPERELVRYFTNLGTVGRVLHEADETTRKNIIATVRAAFDSYVHGDQVRFTAACWMIRARAP